MNEPISVILNEVKNLDTYTFMHSDSFLIIRRTI